MRWLIPVSPVIHKLSHLVRNLAATGMQSQREQYAMGDPEARPNIHIISDSTGETAYAVVKAALARFAGTDVSLHMAVFVRNTAELDKAVSRVRAEPGLVFFTLADIALRDRLVGALATIGAEGVPLIDSHVARLARFLGREPKHEPGLQHRVNEAYFERIAALDFAIAYDDGAKGERLKAADVILTGVSRTSKTPTCIYLAYRGIKAANLPLVPGSPPDPAFLEAIADGIPAVGLIVSPARLEQVRRHRIEALGDRPSDYVDPDRIRREVADSRLFFARYDMPVIDVTRRSIEETAAEIQALLRARGRGLSA